MALGNATAGGDYITRDEWLDLGTEGAVLALRLRVVHEPTQMEKGIVKPVTVDILILAGKRAGEVLRDQQLIGNGQTGPLRKIAIGDDLAATAAIGKNGATQYSQLNPCNERDFALVAKAFEDVAGTKYDNDPYTAAEAAAQGEPARSNGLVNSGATSSGSRPWDRA